MAFAHIATDSLNSDALTPTSLTRPPCAHSDSEIRLSTRYVYPDHVYSFVNPGGKLPSTSCDLSARQYSLASVRNLPAESHSRWAGGPCVKSSNAVAIPFAAALLASAGRDSMQLDKGELATIPRAAIPENS